MHDSQRSAEARIERFIRERIVPAVYRRSAPLSITAAEIPGEPVPFAEALARDFAPFGVGDQWGVPWSTVWFHVSGAVPADWAGPGLRPEIVVDLGFTAGSSGFQAEGAAYSPDGRIIKALEPLNRYVPVGPAGSTVDLYIEAAANPDVADGFSFRPTVFGDRATSGGERLYRLLQLELGLLDETVWELLQDVRALFGLMRELPESLPRRHGVLRALSEMVDRVDPDDVAGTARDGRAALASALASPAHESAHRVCAVGHAHIDSAWLWPVRETVRKVGRTFSNVLALMESDPEFVFAASSAQQYAWLQESNPELFERVKAQVSAGRFVPVGGMWVESDTNLPGGEALVRQFVAGKRYFMEQLGVEPLEVWLPDSFGFSASLPQIVAAAGSRWFLTQKISWNETNRMPHHTFWWEGIDGTRVFTHFPPADTYSSDLSAGDLARAERQYAEKGMGTTSLVPFGWGDGGGGPTREMLAAATRARNLEGSPRVAMATPSDFFEAALTEYPDAPVWLGELYLEFHRGTYTSQARTKRGNRRSEHLLREAELWSALATVRNGVEYPYDALESAWRTVLLQQFHDILPGSSIAWVHQEAERSYARVAEELTAIIEHALRELAGSGTKSIVANAGPFERDGVPGLGASSDATVADAPQATKSVDGFVLENARTRVIVDDRGLVVSLFDRIAERELIPHGRAGNLLQLFRDTPNQWDAWDVDEHYARNGVDLIEADEVRLSDDGRAVVVARSFGASTVFQELALHDTGALEIRTAVDWHESQKLLKLAMPLDVLAERAASEIQFGHVFRATHSNTSWDAARFETVAHRWVHVGEPGYGVVVANDCSYGHDIRRRTESGGRACTVVRVSLLRAPRYPDPEADRGRHVFTISLRPGSGISDAVEEGYRLNLPLRTFRGGVDIAPMLAIDNPALVVESVKLAEDRSGDVIVRLYESLGSRCGATLVPGFAWRTVTETDLLERAIEPETISGRTSGAIELAVRPFRIVTLRFAR